MTKKKKTTALGEALRAAGVNAEENRFIAALSRFLNNCGTPERAHALIDLRGGGQAHGAQQGQKIAAPASEEPRAPAGQNSDAEQANHGLPAGREPSSAARTAARAVSAFVAATVLDSFRVQIRPGVMIAIGDVPVASYGRLLRQAAKRAWVASREYNLIALLKAEADRQAHIPATALTRDIFSAEAVSAKIDAAAEQALPAEAAPGEAA